MSNTRTITTLLATAILAAGVSASPGEYDRDEYYERRGPLPFEILDLNRDGKVTAEEHAQVRAERRAQRAGQGYRMRRAPAAPDFGRIDRDASGDISPDELAAWQAGCMRQRPAGRGPAGAW